MYCRSSLGHVDAYLAVVSRRDTRTYARSPLPDGAAERILQAGRLAGSAKNRQPWRFIVVGDPAGAQRLADAVWAPGNVLGAALLVAITLPRGGSGFDAGRAAQNMMLAAWGDGIASCPNGLRDQEAARAALAVPEDRDLVTVLSFGLPVNPRDPARRTAEEWIARADRRPLDELVRR
jgi:nitroreductase